MRQKGIWAGGGSAAIARGAEFRGRSTQVVRRFKGVCCSCKTSRLYKGLQANRLQPFFCLEGFVHSPAIQPDEKRAKKKLTA